MISILSDSSTTRFFKYKYEIIHEGLNLCTASTEGKVTRDKWFWGSLMVHKEVQLG